MTHIRTVLILIGLMAAPVAMADPGSGSGTGLKPGLATITAVQSPAASTGVTAPRK